MGIRPVAGSVAGAPRPGPARLADRPAMVRRARRLNRLTIGWNTVEGVVAVAAVWRPGR